MIATHNINMDLGRCGEPPRIEVVQNDRYSRDLALALHMNGVKWFPGCGVSAVIHYIKPDGTRGSYDTLDGETPAWRLSGHILTAALAPQVCTAVGLVQLSVCLIRGEAQITTFAVELNVRKDPGLQAHSEDYHRLIHALPDAGWTPNRLLGTDEDGKVTAVSTDPTLSQEGQAADAAAVGNQLSGMIRAVNGSLPDADGHVHIDTGTGSVQSVNGITPDEDGNVDIAAMPLPATAQAGQYLRVLEVNENGTVTAVEAVTLDVSEKTPVAYLYNGYQLFALPEWDRETYPYVMMSILTPTTGSVYCLPEPRQLTMPDKNGKLCIGVPAGMPYLYAMFLSSTQTITLEERIHDTDYLFTAKPKYANYDILNADGTAYLEASEPVPVYEEDTDAPTDENAPVGLPAIELTTQLPVSNSYEEILLTDEENALLDAVFGSPFLLKCTGINDSAIYEFHALTSSTLVRPTEGDMSIKQIGACDNTLLLTISLRKFTDTGWLGMVYTTD